MSKFFCFSQSNVFNFSEVYFFNYPFSKLFLYKEPWFLKEIATPLRGITTFFGTCATLRKKSFGKNLRITIKVHEKKKMIIWILSQNSIVEHFWTEFNNCNGKIMKIFFIKNKGNSINYAWKCKLLSSGGIIREACTAKNRHKWVQSQLFHNSKKIQNLKKQAAIWCNLQAFTFV